MIPPLGQCDGILWTSKIRHYYFSGMFHESQSKPLHLCLYKFQKWCSYKMHTFAEAGSRLSSWNSILGAEIQFAQQMREMLLNGGVAVGCEVVRLKLYEICPFLCIISMRRELRYSWERCSTWGPFFGGGSIRILCIYLFAHVLCWDGKVGWCWDTNQKGSPYLRNPKTFQAKPKLGAELKSSPHILPEFQAFRTMLAQELMNLIPCVVLHWGPGKTTTQNLPLA